jgi:uncharacterized membrane protein YfcA
VIAAVAILEPIGALVVGVASGVLSAVAGVGGAVVTTPGLRALGATAAIALGSTVPAIIPGAATSSIRYRTAGLIDARVAGWCGGFGTASALLGAWVSTLVDARWLMVVTALLLLWSSVTVLRRARGTLPSSSRFAGGGNAQAALGLLVGIGLIAGFVAGLLGVGGGIVLVPAFTLVLGMPTKETVATSLVAVALMSTTSLVGHWLAGHIDWSMALPLALGVIPGARLGSRFTVRSSERAMSLVCGSLLAIFGVIYLARELSGVL